MVKNVLVNCLQGDLHRNYMYVVKMTDHLNMVSAVYYGCTRGIN